jgi:hypothetical protein
MIMRINFGALVILLLASVLGGCATEPRGSIAGGECHIFERPAYAVRGKTQYDQDWVDGNVEAGIGGCKWARPAPRPPELDAAPGTKPAVVKPAKRRGLFRRIKDHVLPKKWPDKAAPVATTPEPPPVVAAPPPPPPPKPRDPVDELLHPTK